jgi:hypothetical protein
MRGNLSRYKNKIRSAVQPLTKEKSKVKQVK